MSESQTIEKPPTSNVEKLAGVLLFLIVGPPLLLLLGFCALMIIGSLVSCFQ